ncbi:Sodium- and chloride-dependent creatine transporter 1 [Bienertia sinuspersici]
MLLYQQYVFDSSISGNSEVQRRPYHRNCSCALHNKSRGNCPHSSVSPSSNVSYPIRRSWSEGTSLALSCSNYSIPLSSSSSSLSSLSNNQ